MAHRPADDTAPGAEADLAAETTPDETVPWSRLLEETRDRFRAAGVDGDEREARWIIERAAGDPYLVVADRPATARSHHHWRLMVERREAGEPLQYVLERWPFRTLELFVDRRVLIPRPETEVVVEAVLDAHGRVGGPVVDLGTGSGAIALAVACERPGTEVWGTDVSADALAVARANCTGLGRRARHVRLADGWWFDALPSDLAGTIGVIVSNPPYVADDEALPPVVEEWEPSSALRAGPDGLDDIRTIVGVAPAWLGPGGTLVIEHGADQGEAVRALAAAAGFASVRTGQDLAGLDRFLVAADHVDR